MCITCSRLVGIQFSSIGSLAGTDEGLIGRFVGPAFLSARTSGNVLLVLPWSCLLGEKCSKAFNGSMRLELLREGLSVRQELLWPSYYFRCLISSCSPRLHFHNYLFSNSRKEKKLNIVKILKMHEVTGKRNKVAFYEKFANKIPL